jgi:hypothetical protein
MSETQGVIRTNISVPRELKARMDAVAERVNWSATAAEAFEAKLLALASTREVKGMDEVIARLKAADDLDSKEEYQAGREAGETWAREDARPKELRALARLAEAEPRFGIEGQLGIYANGMNRGIAWGLCEDLYPHEECRDVTTFWESILGDGGEDLIENHHFALGFCEGALDVWEKVKGKL